MKNKSIIKMNKYFRGIFIVILLIVGLVIYGTGNVGEGKEKDLRAIDVSAGGNRTILIRDDNTLWGTGFNTTGHMGTGDKKNYFEFVYLEDEVKSVITGTVYVFNRYRLYWGSTFRKCNEL